ncbi:MAG: hypothetical protein KGN00_04925 [Chloroflexota bacterium]|nr:hypothetical protein [Chloroflexota bacterium]
MATRLERLRGLWRSEIREVGNETRLLAALAFLITWVITRFITHFLLSRSGGGGLEIGSLHVHHMVFGLVILLVSGILDVRGSLRRTRAVLFGIGAALVLDEFALILNLADVYWKPQGRESIDAVVIFGAVLAIAIAGGGFWRAAWRELARGGRAVARRT